MTSMPLHAFAVGQLSDPAVLHPNVTEAGNYLLLPQRGCSPPKLFSRPTPYPHWDVISSYIPDKGACYFLAMEATAAILNYYSSVY